MYTRWTSHLSTDEEKESFKKEVYSARSVLDRLAQIVKEDYAQLDRSEQDVRAYQSPNWDYLQAHKNGTRQYMNAVILYTDLDQQKGMNTDERDTRTRRPRPTGS